MSAAEHAAFERMLVFLRETRGFDFSAYKRSTLQRRVVRRMDAVGVHGFDHYLDYLQVHTDEFPALFNTILINVTSFFRDAPVWAAITSTVIPELSARARHRPLRIWSAGCAAGQEAYSLAMVLAEQLGLDALSQNVKIYATDLDDEALTDARHAVYTDKQVADVPEPLRARYFDRTREHYAVKRELRRGVIFGHHDLLQDAPISRIDLLLCRNALIYFNADAQARIMEKFFFSVGAGGFVVLGRSETLFSHASLFEPFDLKRRIFRTIPADRVPDREFLAARAGRREHHPAEPGDHGTRLRELAFETARDPQIVIDAEGVLTGVNAAARRQFGVSPANLGAPLQNVELSYRPAELRAHIDRAREERREVMVRGVVWEHPAGTRYLDLAFAPLLAADGTRLGTRVSFSDVTQLKTLQNDLTHSKAELETAYEELQSTNEELETTNEELQSTIEELETTNEELQSTNEELETMNEELQSTNEELQAINDELRSRGFDLNASNAFLQSILTSLRSGVVVCDPEMKITVWNRRAVDLWGLRTEEATGEYFFGLDIGLPVAALQPAAQEVLNARATALSTVLPATNRKGRSMQMRVTMSPLSGPDRKIEGVIVLMDEEPVLD